jgi:hypothetical protein
MRIKVKYLRSSNIQAHVLDGLRERTKADWRARGLSDASLPSDARIDRWNREHIEDELRHRKYKQGIAKAYRDYADSVEQTFLEHRARIGLTASNERQLAADLGCWIDRFGAKTASRLFKIRAWRGASAPLPTTSTNSVDAPSLSEPIRPPPLPSFERPSVPNKDEVWLKWCRDSLHDELRDLLRKSGVVKSELDSAAEDIVEMVAAGLATNDMETVHYWLERRERQRSERR